MSLSDEAGMRLALEQAHAALDHDDVPIGAVLVDPQGTVLAAAGNERELRRDPTAHAELLVLRSTSAGAESWRREGTTLYVTLEPCPMCAGALVLARVSRLVYGASDPRAGAAYSLYNIVQDPRLNHSVEVSMGLLESECSELLHRFFEGKRGAYGARLSPDGDVPGPV